MNYEIQFRTDTATLGIYDPQVLEHRLNGECDWWCDDLSKVEELKDGRMALISFGGDGCYKVRLTDGPLLPDEESYAVSRLPTLGLKVISGTIFAGPAEQLPGGGVQCNPKDKETKRFFLPMTNGTYSLEIFGIKWQTSGKWHVDDGVPVPKTAPADLVVVVRPRDTAFQAPPEEPRFTGTEKTWLYPEKTRQIGPVVGMTLNATVVQRRDELVLRETGPLNYRPVLTDMSNLQRKDVIKVSVLSVDEGTKSMQVERISDDPPTKWWTRIFKGRGL